jgi:hypothetical protein
MRDAVKHQVRAMLVLLRTMVDALLLVAMLRLKFDYALFTWLVVTSALYFAIEGRTRVLLNALGRVAAAAIELAFVFWFVYWRYIA